MIWRYDVNFSLKIRSFHNTISNFCVMFSPLHSRTAGFFADLHSRKRISVDEFCFFAKKDRSQTSLWKALSLNLDYSQAMIAEAAKHSP